MARVHLQGMITRCVGLMIGRDKECAAAVDSYVVDTYGGYIQWIHGVDVDVREEASKIQGVGTFAAATIWVGGCSHQLPL